MKTLGNALLALLVSASLVSAVSPLGRAETESPSPTQTLYLGQQVYQINCAVCHGIGGDGNGPASSMFQIRPRDFRRGLFKFRSTRSGSLPTDSDLLRTVSRGFRWTGMIGRPDLNEFDRQAVVQYVKTFSSRFMKERAGKPVTVPPAPERTKQVLEQGKKLYREVGCYNCHGEQGRGDGRRAGELKDDWGRKIWPSDLTWRPLKRGSEPREIYLTVATGLSGTPMPEFASSLNSQQLWSLIYYIESLVPPDHRFDPDQMLGEERQAWMAVKMGEMMGGMMGRGMMHGMR